MNILIAYDGSKCAKAAIADLSLAGLPRIAHARLITIAEMQPEGIPSTLDPGYATSFMYLPLTPITTENLEALTQIALRDAATVGDEGVPLVEDLFPDWIVESATRSDSPAAGILDEAQQWQADLIVVGSHGRSAVGRAFFGSVSQKIVKYAQTTVRVARGRSDREAGGARILVAFDGSPESQAALNAVASRPWASGTQVHILTVVDAHLARGFPLTAGKDLAGSLQEAGRLAASGLKSLGLEAEPLVRKGDPKREILAEAEHWQADCIFIGTHGLGAAKRFLLGTAASAVISRAHCSVEVVRKS